MLIADTNEFHRLDDGEKYRDSREPDGTNHPIVIMRVSYGNTHIDAAYGPSIRQARHAKLYVGHYGYMVADEDPGAQGSFFGHIIAVNGGLHTGDTIWCDCEEGTGNQAGRSMEFLVAAHAVLHDRRAIEGVYSGEIFWQTHLGTLSNGDLRWVAAYGTRDPHLPGEDLWQFTDNRSIPGVAGPCDASIYKGDVNDFLKMIGAASTGKFLEDQEMQYIDPGAKATVAWPDGAKAIRFVTDSPDAIPAHVAWFTQDPNSNFTVTVGGVTEVDIPGARGAVIHRDDASTDSSANRQFGFVFTS